jgi:pimeloyl-ACP methyl ester carboxylesterase
MRSRLEPAHQDAVAATRVVMLPAANTGPDDFVSAGFVSAARERSIPLDFVLIDLHLMHLNDRTLLGRLRREVILPAHAAGCRTVWLCGISLGGFIALTYAERYAGDIEGVCVLAPYLGNRIVTREIALAGGVSAWEPGGLAVDDDERRIWRFIKNAGKPSQITLTEGARRRPGESLVHLGFGSEDRFADSHRMMAAALPPEMVHVVPGGHDWPVWRQLWDNFLDRRLGAPRSSPPGRPPSA